MPTLHFEGKDNIESHHYEVPYRSLKADPAKSVAGAAPEGEGNLIVHGDNLHALKALLPRYAGRVNCVYIDPPYNTGNEGWSYNDNVNSPLMRRWLKENGAVDGDDPERHDKWLCMMWPRLNLLHELLAEDGAIFVSIDDNEQHHLRVVMDEIFGEENFVANIVWNHRRSRNNDTGITLSHNHIVCFAKDKSAFTLRALPADESKFSNPDGDPKGDWVADPMDAPVVRENLTYPIINPNTKEEHLPPRGRHWRFSKAIYDKAFAEGRIIFSRGGEGRPQYKRYRTEAVERGQNVTTLWNEPVWTDVETATQGTNRLQALFPGEGKVFETPKPVGLIAKILAIATDENSVVLDSFAGSGTTADAVLQANAKDGGRRRFILVEVEDYADKITAERVRRVIRGVPKAKDKATRDGLGGGFTFCTLGEDMGVERLLAGKDLPSYSDLACHVFYVATGRPLESAEQKDDWLVGETEHHRVHLIYRPDAAFLRSNDSGLTFEFAEKVGAEAKAKGKIALVFATMRFGKHAEMKRNGTIFCRLPTGILSIPGV